MTVLDKYGDPILYNSASFVLESEDVARWTWSVIIIRLIAQSYFLVIWFSKLGYDDIDALMLAILCNTGKFLQPIHFSLMNQVTSRHPFPPASHGPVTGSSPHCQHENDFYTTPSSQKDRAVPVTARPASCYRYCITSHTANGQLLYITLEIELLRLRLSLKRRRL